MSRRQVAIAVLALGLPVAPFPSHGQQPAKIYRIGWLAVSPGGYETNPHQCPIQGSPLWRAWVEGLRKRGYIPGQNLVIECRYTEGREERAPALATELVNLKVDLLVAFSTANVRAAKQATSTLPIVMVGVIDPVGRGLVASLAHPGWNVTGLTNTVGIEIEGNVCSSSRKPSLRSLAWPSWIIWGIRLNPSSGGRRRRRRGRSP